MYLWRVVLKVLPDVAQTGHDEVWRGLEPTRTFVRFMISHLRDTSDSSLGDRFDIQQEHAATVSEYDWVPPQQPDGKRRAYYASNTTGRSYEAAYQNLWRQRDR